MRAAAWQPAMAEFEVGSAEEFERGVLRAPEPTVVMFWAAWCPFCRSFRPAFDARASQSRARFAVVRLDDEDNPLWDAYRVDVVPTLAYFRGGELVARKDGKLGRGLGEPELAAFLREASVVL